MSLFGNPGRLAKYFGSLWGQLYDSGVVTGEYEETGKLVVHCGAWLGHGSVLCHTTLGSLETLAEEMAGPRLTSAEQTACIGRGDGRCRYEFSFQTDGSAPNGGD